MRFQQAQQKMCHSPKVENGVDNYFFFSFVIHNLEIFWWRTLKCNKSYSIRAFDLIPTLRARLENPPVMSTNIWIFEYSNKRALKYYSDSDSCHFPSTNIFGYSFGDFWEIEYIQIFVRKYSKILIYLNICLKPYFNIWLSIFNNNKKIYLGPSCYKMVEQIKKCFFFPLQKMSLCQFGQY